ncbi:MAG TPA: hypothetical protein VF114_05640, partial [Candidatus Limnocylindria bacterium]
SMPMIVSERVSVMVVAIVPIVVAGPAILCGVKIGEWDNLGRARAVVQRQLGDLGAAEYAAHVTLNQETGRIRVYVATDIGLLEYTYGPAGADPEGAWMLRGQMYRWGLVKGLRLQTEAQIDDDSGEVKAVWRLVAEDPKLDLAADSEGVDDRAVGPMLAFARACIQNAG